MSKRMYIIGIDVGGTFTDAIVLETETGRYEVSKVPSTPHDPSVGTMVSIGEHKHLLNQTRYLVHGSTVADNILIERKGAVVGLLTTRGHKDRLFLQRTNQQWPYDYAYHKPKPFVARDMIREVKERISADGTIRMEVDEASVLEGARQLIAKGAQILVVACLNSWVNASNEQRIGGLLRERWPTIPVVTSAEVAPEPLEYERFSAATITAYLKPIISTYLDHMQRDLGYSGLKGGFMIMQASGGVMTPEVAKEKCALMIECGPAAGVIGAAQLGKFLGYKNVIAFDMGGTTAKTCVIYDGYASVSYENTKERFPLNLPMLNTVSIGAGGGSKAWIDAQGGLHVGPDSAGADPGPACYGKGNEAATVTDAHVVLGRLQQEYFLGGKMKIFPELSLKAVKRIADHYGIEPQAAAAGILRIVNSSMANLVRAVTIEKGYDPRDFVLLAYGGAGPMHAGTLAEELKIPAVVIPTVPGIFSAWGMTVADIKHDLVRAVVVQTSKVDLRKVNGQLEEMRSEATDLLCREGVSEAEIAIQYYMDMRYVGQAYIPCTVGVPKSSLNSEDIQTAVKDFHEMHHKYYKWSANEEVEIVNLRITATGITEKPAFRKVTRKEVTNLVQREVYFEGINGGVQCDFYNREELAPGSLVDGPAVIHQYDGTTVVYPRQKATVDEYENIVIRAS